MNLVDDIKYETVCILNSLRTNNCKECILNNDKCEFCEIVICKKCDNGKHNNDCPYFSSILRKILLTEKDLTNNIKDFVVETNNEKKSSLFSLIKEKVYGIILIQKFYDELKSKVKNFKNEETNPILDLFYKSNKSKQELLKENLKIYKEILKREEKGKEKSKKRKFEERLIPEQREKREKIEEGLIFLNMSKETEKELNIPQNFEIFQETPPIYKIKLSFDKNIYKLKKQMSNNNYPPEKIIFKIKNKEIGKYYTPNDVLKNLFFNFDLEKDEDMNIDVFI